jgi:transglutaminase-like putative cysteine protease/tetratricopeptide (TPR) repeat protein
MTRFPALALLLAMPLAAGAVAGDDPADRQLAVAIDELRRDRSGPRGLVALAAIVELCEDVADRKAAEEALARVAADARAHPEVRALARFELAAFARSRGDLDAAAAEVGRLGLLRDWWIAGPFDNEGKRGHAAAFPPEQAQDLAARFAGKAREVGWRALPPEAAADGFVHLGAALRPAREVTAYALAVLDAPRDERARLHLGASGAVKVWVNGALAVDDPAHHAARPDQLAAAIPLRRGPNRILVKVSHADGRFGFYARVVRPSGEPVPLRALAPPFPPEPPAAGEASRVPTAVDALEGRLRAAQREGAPAERVAALRQDLAVALDLRRAGEARERRAAEEARRAAAALPRSVDAQLLAARLEEDGNRRRERLLAAVRAGPRDARALVALARHHLERAEPHRALPLARRAVEASPRHVPARLALADALDGAGLASRARRERLALADERPDHPAAVLAGARASLALERGDEAAAQLRSALALRFDERSARASLVQLLVDRADGDGALALLADAVRLDPAALPERLRRADLLAAVGRGDEAEAEFAAAARIAPEEPEVLERRGEARLRAGLDREALADLEAALALRPQDAKLKELVRALEPARERFERPYLQDARALAAAAPAGEPDEDAVVLSDLRVTRVHPSGLSSSYTQLVVRVLTRRGADDFRSHSVAYAPDRQEIRIERARVLKPDGSVVESHGESDRSTSEPWYRLYYDTRARVLSFPALAPGDVLELAVRRDDVAGENLLSDYFGELVFAADTTRKLRFEYVLLAPAAREIHAADPRLEGARRSERRLEGDVVERRWTAEHVPRVRPEPGMPGWSEVAPYVHVSTYASWEDVQRFWWGLVHEQLEPTPEIRELATAIAREALAARRAPPARNGNGRRSADPEAAAVDAPLPPLSREDELAIVRAIHAFVVTNTRYVALEVGIHGYKPYRVDQVLERRFGDCKDKASLAHAMLRAVGIDSRLVLLRMKRLGRVPERPASLAVFNHAILHVPGHDLWLDGTATYSGSADLPPEDRGATVLVVNPGGKPWFGTVPEARPEENRTESRFEVALSDDGSARVRGASRIAGVQAPGYRRAYEAERNRRAAFEQAFSRTFPGLEVKEVALSDLSRLDDAVDLSFTLELPRLAEREGGGLRFLPFGNAHRYVESWAPLSAREHDLAVGEPYENRFAFRYELPAGWEPLGLPPAAAADGDAAAFEVAYRREPGAVVAEGRVVLKRSRVEPAGYAAFRELAIALDRALARPIRLAPASAAHAPAGARP